MSPPPELNALVEKFHRNRDVYLRKYNETQVRVEFINPLFELLGWDVLNKDGHSEAYKDVIHEYAFKMGGVTVAPDYCFTIGGTRKFFLETKRPSIKIKDDPIPAFQIRRYGWSAKLPLSILTDFQEFSVYDCRIKPAKNDKASTARPIYITYDEYVDRWDEIESVFSKKAVLQGDFDRYVDSKKKKKGTAEVDAAFLKEIEVWRETLAKNIALRNNDLSHRDINFAVLRIIDRIIFLRMCEDRNIEKYGQLQALLNGGDTYPRLCRLFRNADDKYNSGLFHFKEEKGRPTDPDHLTLDLSIDDKILKDIFKGIYYPESPYEFSVFPSEILGQVYEQFLGKVIRLTKGHRAVIEEKPEVKKAGGVYYTPKYIVDYIVKQTVGKLLESKKPGKTTDKIKILDPACGSGSFLLGAYQYLLDWYRDHYEEAGPEKHKKILYKGAGDEWRLSTEERKRILLTHIHGVDIDMQAVETTKLSLLLKVLEGESGDSLDRQLKLYKVRALPDLGDNIKCGNSLIGPDFYDGQQMSFLDEEEQYRINVFDWNTEFSQIIKSGGFDAVIGNPPYLNIDDTWGKGDLRQRYIKTKYFQIYNDKTDILFYFLGKAVDISKEQVGLIISRAFLEAYKADKLRGWLSKNIGIREILDFRNYSVFPKVGITTAIVLLSKGIKNKNCSVYQLKDKEFFPSNILKQKNNKEIFLCTSKAQRDFNHDSWVFTKKETGDLNNKIDDIGISIGSFLSIGQGMQTGRNNVFGKLDRKRVSEWKLDEKLYFSRARNSDISRYNIADNGEILLYLEDLNHFQDLPKPIQNHLKTHEKELKKRAAYSRGDCEWWKFTWPLHKEHIERNKLYSPYLAPFNRFAIDETNQFLGLTDTTVIFDSGQPEELKYLMGLLNSKLLNFRFKTIGKLKSGGIFEYFWNSISKLPICRIDFSTTQDKERHDRMVELVEQMLDLNKKLAETKTNHDKTVLQRQIDATDKQIDQLVYELYNLTPEEIAIVEGSAK